MSVRRWWVYGAALGAVGAVLGPVTAVPVAGASGGGPLALNGAAPIALRAGEVPGSGPAATQRSLAIAGYGVKGNTVTSFAGAFVVPTLTCPATASYTNQLSLQVDGGLSGGSFVTLNCQGGIATYSAKALIVGGATKAFTVAAGDRVTTSMAVTTSNGTRKLALKVVVAHTSTTKLFLSNTTGAVTHAWAVFEDAPGPVVPFGTVRWSGVTMNGAPLGTATPTRYVLVTGTKTLVSTTKFGTSGLGFTNTFLAS